MLGASLSSLESDKKGGSVRTVFVSVNVESNTEIEASIFSCLYGGGTLIWGYSVQEQSTCLARPGFNLQHEKRGETEPLPY